MNEIIAHQEVGIRLGVFLSVFFSLYLWELIHPRRVLRFSKKARWLNNWAIAVFNSLLIKIAFPVLAVGAAIFAEQNQWGLFNNLTLVSMAIESVVSLPYDIHISLFI